MRQVRLLAFSGMNDFANISNERANYVAPPANPPGGSPRRQTGSQAQRQIWASIDPNAWRQPQQKEQVSKERDDERHLIIDRDREEALALAERSRALRAKENAKVLITRAGGIAAEAIWPTRCSICDAPGKVLCDNCANNLPFLDIWRACPRCGAPYGRAICTECNDIALSRMQRVSLPFEACVSAVMFTNETGGLVRIFKDQGEQRLAGEMAKIMSRFIPVGWPIDAVSYIPASAAAVRRRGFDHAELLATSLAEQLKRPLVHLLERPKSIDQRGLTRKERAANLQGRFQTLSGLERELKLAPRLLLVDDVLTTGATLCSAADALLEAGFIEVRCATFARVY